MALASRAFALALLSSSCGGSGAVPEAPPQSPPRAQKEVRPNETVPLPLAAADLFERGRQLSARIEDSVLESTPERLTQVDMERLRLRLTAASGAETWLSVDDHAPRPATGQDFVVADLINEDVELSPGSHFLIGTRILKSGDMIVHPRIFFVDVEPAGAPPPPGCVVHAPQLTFNGSAVIPRFWSLPLMAEIDRVEYEAKGPGYKSRGSAPPGTEMLMKTAPSGDILLSIRCYSGEEERGFDTQMITVNRDALDPEEAD